MQISDLSVQLQEDAAQDAPPFGAESVKMARQIGPDAKTFLLDQIAARGKTTFLALEALRESDPAAYNSLSAQERADIYVDALRNNLFFNAWGLPGHSLTPTAHALIALGDEAVFALKPLLEEKGIAPLSGSEDATTSTIYRNRICDYAWVLISEIKNLPYTYAQDPAERDHSIDALRQSL